MKSQFIVLEDRITRIEWTTTLLWTVLPARWETGGVEGDWAEM